MVSGELLCITPVRAARFPSFARDLTRALRRRDERAAGLRRAAAAGRFAKRLAGNGRRSARVRPLAPLPRAEGCRRRRVLPGAGANARRRRRRRGSWRRGGEGG
eukprot:2582027-Rhodomonas_salina.4